MKFCTKCGAELYDEAIICVKCGRMVENPPLPKSKPIKVKPPRIPRANGEPSILLIVSNFVHSLGVALSLFFLFLGFGYPYVNSRLETKKVVKEEYITGVYTYFNLDSDVIITAFIFSCVALAFGIISFVMTLWEKHKFERLFTSISRLTIGIISFACTFILLCF